MLPKETLSELLNYIADNEELKSIEQLGTVTPHEVRTALRELATELRIESLKEQDLSKSDYQKHDELTRKVKQVLSALTPREFQILFKQFGIEN
jgi:DNA-directed RNA polymerase sigma subunit (sigma70/sigma32)